MWMMQHRVMALQLPLRTLPSASCLHQQQTQHQQQQQLSGLLTQLQKKP
jgi:hypothetical protein